MKNALTIDLEDHYHATAFSTNQVSANSISHTSRVEGNAERLLEILARRGSLATFFTVGSVAERFPGLIRTIAAAGHELACHSYAHRLIFTMSREEFCEDTRRAKCAIEDAAGLPIRGYRAPSFSITNNTEWAFEVLAELGFSYDSSIFPIKHVNFDMRTALRTPFFISTKAGSIMEFPMPTLQFLGSRAPLAGGAYLRLLPYWYTRWGIRYLNRSERHPVCVYLHPWELDPEQPRMKGTLTARMRHYFGLHGAEEKFRRLLSDFEFGPLGNILDDIKAISLQAPDLALPAIRPRELCSD
jgi:polysaccharide deacetylase family protein (PEP-CTERM system associated)